MKTAIMTFVAAGVFAAFAMPAPNDALQARLDAEEDIIGIVHWGLNTFTDREWGYGDEDPKRLDPPKFDADQIVRACADGGIRGLVVVAKHHDGFCLWPTKTTPHNISASPFRGGKGDYVREMADACRRSGVRFGVYCSPWDRNNADYATDAYVKTFHAQVTELLSNYGEVFEMWFDGANGGDGYYGGAREKRKISGDGYYRFGELFKTVRRLQPKVTIFGMGGEYAWPGNERGIVDPEKSPSTEELYRMWEADFPLRKGWFHHERESGTVRSGEFLMKIYLRSVGHGGTMNIGIAPDRDGLLPPEDVAALRHFREVKDAFFAHPVKDGPFNVVVTKNAYGVKRILKTGDPSVAGARYLVDEALIRRIDEATGPDGETDTARWMTGRAKEVK